HHRGRVDAAPAGLDADDAVTVAHDPRHRRPLTDRRAELLRATPEALHGVGRTGVAALGLPGGRADVLDVGEGLEVPELGWRERDRVDADAVQHLDVLPEVLGVRGRD